MSVTVDIFSAFACPAAVSDDAFFDQVNKAYYEATRSNLIEDEKALAGLPESTHLDFDQVDLTLRPCASWMPEMGHVTQILRRGGPSVRNAYVQFVLANMHLGATFDHRLETFPSETLYFNGCQIFTGDWLTIQCDGNALRIQTMTQDLTFERRQKLWVNTSHPGLPIHPDYDLDLNYFAGYCNDPGICHFNDCVIEADQMKAAAQSVQNGFALLKETAPAYYRWCHRPLRQVLFVGKEDRDKNITSSRSVLTRPGAVLMSAPADPVLIAEVLAHECSHQHYFMASLLGRVERDPQVDEEFYSALVDKNRNMERILLAHHAVVNIMLTLDAIAVRSSEYGARAAARARDMAPISWDLFQTVKTNSHLLNDTAVPLWSASADLLVDTFDRHDLPKARAAAA